LPGIWQACRCMPPGSWSSPDYAISAFADRLDGCVLYRALKQAATYLQGARTSIRTTQYTAADIRRHRQRREDSSYHELVVFAARTSCCGCF
jgi:hypothetical protein